MKLRHISIKDYKGIDHLELDFPAPKLPTDPDVIVIGSENGLGKTSVLECCALSLHVIKYNKAEVQLTRILTKFTDILVRSGQPRMTITSTCSDNKTVSLMVSDQKCVQANESHYGLVSIPEGLVLIGDDNSILGEPLHNSNERDFIGEMCGLSANPIIESNVLFFHSYRKVLEGNPTFGSLLGGQPANGNGSSSLVSVFKRTVLFSMMNSANLFDGPRDEEAIAMLETLNQLLEQYAECRFTKMRPMRNDTVELRVQPINGGDSFNFDGLSSGQKEIITTLFLICHETRKKPKVVLIDEPELHLNSQWHRSFVNSLVALAPQNQYIIATHSATIMDSVDRSRRILLQQDKEAVR